MAENEEKYTCVYCHCEFDSFDKNIVICDKCGNPYHKDCWDENEKCSMYGCNSTSAHNPLRPLTQENKKKEEPIIITRPILVPQSNPVINEDNKSNTSLLLYLIIAIVIVIFGTVAVWQYYSVKKNRFETKIICESSITLGLNDTKNFSWHLDKDYDIDESKISIKNNNPELFQFKENDNKYNLSINSFNTEKNGSFEISVKDKRLKIKKQIVKVNINDPNKPIIKITPKLKRIKCNTSTEFILSSNHGSIIGGEITADLPGVDKINFKSIQNKDNQCKMTIFGNKPCKVEGYLNIPISNYPYPVKMEIEFEFIE